MNVEPMTISNETDHIVIQNNYGQFCIVKLKSGRYVPVVPEIQYLTLNPGKYQKVLLKQRVFSEANTTIESHISQVDTQTKYSLSIRYCTSSQKPSNEQQLINAKIKKHEDKVMLIPYIQQQVVNQNQYQNIQPDQNIKQDDTRQNQQNEVEVQQPTINNEQMNTVTPEQADNILQSIDGFQVFQNNQINQLVKSEALRQDSVSSEKFEKQPQMRTLSSLQKNQNEECQQKDKCLDAQQVTCNGATSQQPNDSNTQNDKLKLFSNNLTVDSEHPDSINIGVQQQQDKLIIDKQKSDNSQLQKAISSSISVIDQMSDIHLDNHKDSYVSVGAEQLQVEQIQFPSTDIHKLNEVFTETDANQVSLSQSAGKSNQQFNKQENDNDKKTKITNNPNDQGLSKLKTVNVESNVDDQYSKSNYNYSMQNYSSSSSSYMNSPDNDFHSEQDISDDLLVDQQKKQQIEKESAFDELFNGNLHTLNPQHSQQTDQKVTSDVTSSSIIGDKSLLDTIQDYQEKVKIIDEQLNNTQKELDNNISRMKKYEKRTKKMQDRLDALNVVYVFIVISLILKKLILKK